MGKQAKSKVSQHQKQAKNGQNSNNDQNTDISTSTTNKSSSSGYGLFIIIPFFVIIAAVGAYHFRSKIPSIKNWLKKQQPKPQIIEWEWELVKEHPRPNAGEFITTGLLYINNTTMLESTGGHGFSKLQFLDYPSLAITKEIKLTDEYFGQGITIITKEDDTKEIYQLTWKENVVFVYDYNTLEIKRTLQIPSDLREGFGLTSKVEIENGIQVTNLYISDGTWRIFVCDPEDLHIKRIHNIIDKKGSFVMYLDQLAFIKGKLWAGQLIKNRIGLIDLTTNKVEQWLNFEIFVNEVKTFYTNYNVEYNPGWSLSGFAYDSDSDTILIGGKKWPNFYEITLKEINSTNNNNNNNSTA